MLGKVWLPRIFIFVLLLGLVWGFRIAVDAGWLNEISRVVIGFITAGAFYYLGNRQLEKNRTALGKVLLVGFVATLLVTTFAMNVLYSLVPSVVAFILNIIWVAIGIYLSHRHRSEAMGVMFAIAGYLIPFLVAGSGTAATLLMVIGYEFIYYFALLWFAVRSQFRILYYVSAVFLHLVYLVLAIAAAPVFESIHTLMMAIAILLQHEALFYTLLKEKMQKLHSFPVLFTSFLATLLWAKSGFEAYDAGYLFTVYVTLTVLRYGWTAYQAKEKQKDHLFSIAAVIATAGIAALIADSVDNEYAAAGLYLVHGTLAIYVGYTFGSKMQRIIGYFIYYLTAFILISDPVIYTVEDLLLWTLFVVTVFVQVIFSVKEKDEALFPFHLAAAVLVHLLFLFGLEFYNTSFGPLFWLGIIGSLAWLYVLARSEMSSVIRQIYTGVSVVIHLIFIAYLADYFILEANAEVLATTAGWAVYALGCVYLGVQKQHKPLRMLGIGLILFTLAKLILFDLAFVSLVTRAILFVFLGLVGIVVSRFFYGKGK